MSGGHLCAAEAPTEAEAETHPLPFYFKKQMGGHKGPPYEKTIYLFLFYHLNLPYIVADKLFGGVATYKP